jgi:6-pyruvoyltetrahydropterin/6-carboxytetrahydropterin synthase
MNLSCTRIIEFDAAHRIIGHESKCATLHGHRYKIEITARPTDGLDAVGRVIDFGVIKTKCGRWIDHFWDHTCILKNGDPLIEAILSDKISFKPPYIVEWNPTAENMCTFLFSEFSRLLSEFNISVTKIRVYETPNCYAEASI